MRRKRSRSQMAAIDQINVTPLLDLTFLLLIVFMITMPLMEYGTSVNPPEMNADKLPETDFKSVTLTKQGTIVFDRETVTKDELVELLKQLRERSPKTTVLLRADGERSYNDVIELLTFIKNSGFRGAGCRPAENSGRTPGEDLHPCAGYSPADPLRADRLSRI